MNWEKFRERNEQDAYRELRNSEGTTAYYHSTRHSSRPTPRYDKTPLNPNQADLTVYAESLRAEAEQIDSTSFLSRLLGL